MTYDLKRVMLLRTDGENPEQELVCVLTNQVDVICASVRGILVQHCSN